MVESPRVQQAEVCQLSIERALRRIGEGEERRAAQSYDDRAVSSLATADDPRRHMPGVRSDEQVVEVAAARRVDVHAEPHQLGRHAHPGGGDGAGSATPERPARRPQRHLKLDVERRHQGNRVRRRRQVRDALSPPSAARTALLSSSTAWATTLPGSPEATSGSASAGARMPSSA